MKKSFLFMSLLLGLFVSVFALTACSSDDNDEGAPESLVGTEWTLTTSSGYHVVISIQSTNIGRMTVKDPEGKVTEDFEWPFSYDEATGVGSFVTNEGEEATFVIKGNTLTITFVGSTETQTYKRTK